jgi:hypothetical protein
VNREAALIAAYVRQPAWIDSHSVALDTLTTYEARAVLVALGELRRAGTLVDREDMRREQIAGRGGIPVSVLKRMDEECWDADVPALVRHLRDLHTRRRLALAGEAAVVYAHDLDRDVARSVAQVRAVVAEVTP